MNCVFCHPVLKSDNMCFHSSQGEKVGLMHSSSIITEMPVGFELYSVFFPSKMLPKF